MRHIILSLTVVLGLGTSGCFLLDPNPGQETALDAVLRASVYAATQTLVDRATEDLTDEEIETLLLQLDRLQDMLRARLEEDE